MRLLSVDPGLRSGLFIWTGADDWSGGIYDPMPLIDGVDELLREEPFDLIVCEAYKITAATAQKSQQPWSLELIGALRWLAHRAGVEFVLQTPAEAKGFCPDQRLRDLGFWFAGKEDHCRDAARHAVLALAKRRELVVGPLGG